MIQSVCPRTSDDIGKVTALTLQWGDTLIVIHGAMVLVSCPNDDAQSRCRWIRRRWSRAPRRACAEERLALRNE
jgi:hypothetical protein